MNVEIEKVTLDYLVMIAVKYQEITNSRAVELLKVPFDEIRERSFRVCGEKCFICDERIKDKLVGEI